MKFVYFDVGGVLIKDLSDDDNGWKVLLKKLGLKDSQQQKFDDFFDIFEKDLEKGKKLRDFPLIMRDRFGINLPNNYSIGDDMVNNFFVRNEGIWQIVNSVKNKYKVGLLTNMYEGMLNLIKEKGLIPNMNWDVIADSSIEKCRKPDRKIYEIAQKRAEVESSEILFIDNKQENLEIPKQMGWQTYWYNPGDYEKSNWKLAEILR